MKRPLAPGLVALAMITMVVASSRSATAAPGFAVNLRVVGGVYRMFRAGIDHPALRITAYATNGKAHQVAVRFRVTDIFDKPVAWNPAFTVSLPANGARVRKTIAFVEGKGYFSIWVTFRQGAAKLMGWTDLGIVPPPWPGVRPNSLFATNDFEWTTEGMDFLRDIGMKVERSQPLPTIDSRHKEWIKEYRHRAAPLDFRRLDQALAQAQARGLWLLPIVGYALQGSGATARTRLAAETGEYGPPSDYRQFVATWKEFLEHYPRITTYEFWNEPWIFAWTWAAPPSAYRRLQRMWCQMALSVNPRLRIIAGSSTPFVVDHIEFHPSCWKGLLSGVTEHPYCYSTGQPTWRAGDILRDMDSIHLAAQRMGLPYAYLTEGGTSYSSPPTPRQALLLKQLEQVQNRLHTWQKSGRSSPSQWAVLRRRETALRQALAQYPLPQNNIQNASKIVEYYVWAAMAGLFQGNAQKNIGYGPGWTRSNTTLAVLTHFLEDRVPVADIWPREELLTGCIFANRKWITPAVKALPRAGDLAARWDVAVPPSRTGDQTKVAVLWSLTGPSAGQLDQHGTLTIADADGLRADDMTGRPIPAVNGKLVVPLGQNPVYLTSDRLSVIQLRRRIRHGLIAGVTPLNMYALSLSRPVTEPQTLTVRVQNQLDRPIRGTLVLRLGGIRASTGAAWFDIPAGQLATVPIHWPGAALSPHNQYKIHLRATISPAPGEIIRFPPVHETQLLTVACFVRRRVALTGSIGRDFHDLTPVVMDSRLYSRHLDLSRYLRNPHLKAERLKDKSGRIIAWVYTAYDRRNVFLGVKVHEKSYRSSAGKPVVRGRFNTKVTLPYLNGMPDGLNYFTFCGDAFEFSFGFRRRVPGWGRPVSSPWAWKGDFYDADYAFGAYPSALGPQLIRVWGPNTPRCNGYQTAATPGIGPVPGARIRIVRKPAAAETIYEIAIPRNRLRLFHPSKRCCRFGFILYNSENVAGGEMNWSRLNGVFDYWRSSGSFPPTWTQHLAGETFFGIQR